MTPIVRRHYGATMAPIIAGLFLAAGCARKPAGKDRAQEGRERVTPVRVAPVERLDVFQVSVEVTGSVLALEDVQLFAKTPGRLEILMVREGERVSAGQPVAIIERRAVEAMLQAAKAGLDVTKAQAAAAEVGLQSAATEARRLRSLFENGSVTQQQLDGAETAYRAASARRDLSTAQIAQVTAQLDAATIQLDECTIRSPMNGIVVDDFDHSVGGMMSPQVPVLHVADMSKVRVVVRVSEEELGSIVVGRYAYVSVVRYQKREFAGKVASISPTIDVRSRTAKVEILVDNPIEDGSHALKPGMFARARVVTAEVSGALVISDHAIQDEGGGRFVFVAEDGRARRRVVTVGMSSGDRAAIVEGLAEGEVVVVEGAAGLPDGARIKTEGAPRE